MKFKIGQKIFRNNKVSEVVVISTFNGDYYYTVIDSDGWFKKDHKMENFIIEGTLNDIDSYYNLSESNIEKYVRAYYIKSKKIPAAYIVYAENEDEIGQIKKFFKLNYPLHLHLCKYRSGLVPSPGPFKIGYAVYPYEKFPGSKDIEHNKKGVCCTKTNISLHILNEKNLVEFSFGEWKDLVDSQEFKVGDIIEVFDDGHKPAFTDENGAIIEAIIEREDVRETSYIIKGEKGWKIYELSRDLNKDISFGYVNDIDSYFAWGKEHIRKKLQNNITSGKIFKIKYLSIDGIIKQEEIESSSLEEAKQKIKDLKEFYYHMEY